VTSGGPSARLIKMLTIIERMVIAGLMAAITGLTLAQVFCRYVLELPLQWSEEVARYCFVWVTFLGAAALMRLPEGHPAIDALHHAVGARARRAMEIAVKLVTVIGSLAIAAGGLRLSQLQWHQLSPSLEFPMAYVYLAMFIGPLIGVFWLAWCARYGSVTDET
jgi:TRAP-type C4-dicarboxylate transport system permease small subunit